MMLNIVVRCWNTICQPSKRNIGVVVLSSLLVACGSGSGSNGSSTVSQSTTVEEVVTPEVSKQISIQGGAIKGVIENGVVRVFSIESEAGLFRKSALPLGDAERTDANGQFNVSIPADAVDAIVVEITADANTRMTCDVVDGCGLDENGSGIIFGEKFSLNEDFILEAAYSGLQDQQALTLYVTPLTHLAVNYAKTHSDGLSTDNINDAYSLIETALKLSSGSLQLPPPDLTKLDSYVSLSGDELQYAVMSASFLALVNTPDWGSIDEVINSAAERFSKFGVLPSENSGAISEVTLDDLFYQASDIASDLQVVTSNEQILVELVSVESSTEMYYQEVSSLYNDEPPVAVAPEYPVVQPPVVVVPEEPVVNPPVVVAPETPAALPISITSHPGSVVANVNDDIELQVSAQGTGTILYQWRKGGVNIEGETSSQLLIDSAQLLDSGDYDVMVADSSGQVSSTTANIIVEPVVVLTANLSWTIPSKRQDNTNLTLSEIQGYVVAYGVDPNNLEPQPMILGADSTSYLFKDLEASTAYYFRIATVDIDGVQGEYSDMVEKVFM